MEMGEEDGYAREDNMGWGIHEYMTPWEWGHVRVNDDKVEREGWHVRVLLMQQVVSGNRQPGSVLPCDVIHSFVFISLRRQPE